MLLCMLTIAFGLLGLVSVNALDVLSKIDPNKLNVHLIPHSHDDPGWLKTADQYFSGSNSSIYTASVEQIFNSVVTELMKDSERTFSFCEVSFFQRWWHGQTPKMKSTVKYLFENGQLSFLNGGWVMHDEASSHFVSMIDQTTLGHRFLLEELNYRPRVGWQIDPFGHSNTHAWLSNEVGFDALYFGRIDYQDKAKRFKEKSMELVWQPSKSDPSVQIYAGAFSDGNYGPPSDFCLDTTCPYCRNDPVVTDPLLETYNLDAKVLKMIQGIENEQSITRGNHLMLKMGSDFAYSNSQSWYNSIDTIIEAVNSRDTRFNLFYSDPTSYTKARAMETNVAWATKQDDFFPYSDASNTFWTGYFTSRPQFKYFERYASSFLQMLKQVAAQPSISTSQSLLSSAREAIFELTAAVGLVNHHDSITGTAKQHVADDYKKILAKALTVGETAMSKLIHYWMHLPTLTQDSEASTAGSVSGAAGSVLDGAVTTCRLVNETVCSTTQSLAPGQSVVVMTYNPLPRESTETQLLTVLLNAKLFEAQQANAADVSIVVLEILDEKNSQANDVTVEPRWRFVPSEVFPTKTSADVGAVQSGWKLVFPASNVPALSFKRFVVALIDRSSTRLPLRHLTWLKDPDVQIAQRIEPERISLKPQSASSDRTLNRHLMRASTAGTIVSNGVISLLFDETSGQLSHLSRDLAASSSKNNNSNTHSANGAAASSRIEVPIDGISIGYYKGFGPGATSQFRALSKPDKRDPHLQNIQVHPEISTSGVSTQTSGAYIFRPSTANEFLHPACSTTSAAAGGAATAACDGDHTAFPAVEEMVVLRGRWMTEVHQRFGAWASHTLRLTKDSPVLDVEYHLASIPVEEDLIGKEVVYRIQTGLQTLSRPPSQQTAASLPSVPVPESFTDSNGREFMQRWYNYRPTWDLDVYEPIAGNYYPLTASQYVVDRQRDIQFSVVTDRSLGGASLTSGAMEIMIQRRLLHDDYKGVEEALNETVGGITPYPDWQRQGAGIPVSGKLQFLVAPFANHQGIQELRRAMDVAFYAPAQQSNFYYRWSSDEEEDSVLNAWLTTTPAPPQQKQGHVSSPLSVDLPSNVQLVSLERLQLLRSSSGAAAAAHKNTDRRVVDRVGGEGNGEKADDVLLVRLGHAFSVDEDPTDQSLPVTIDLAAVFSHYQLVSMQEVTLSANENKADMLAKKVQWPTEDGISATTKTRDRIAEIKQSESSWMVTLKPMEIRTFVLTVTKPASTTANTRP